jgi:hypothetical protein
MKMIHFFFLSGSTFFVILSLQVLPLGMSSPHDMMILIMHSGVLIAIPVVARLILFHLFFFWRNTTLQFSLWNEQLTIWLKLVGTSCNVKDIFALDFLSEYLTLFKYALKCLVMSFLCLYHHDGICSSPQDGCELHWMLTSLVQSLDALCELFHFLSNLPNLISITLLAFVTLAL